MSTISALTQAVSNLATAMGNALQLRGFKEGGTAGQVPTKINGTDFNWSWQTPSSGDVVGPASATNNAVAVFDGTTGKLLKNGVVLGTAATTNSSAYATASQGALADTAVQPAALADYLPLAGGVAMGGSLDMGGNSIGGIYQTESYDVFSSNGFFGGTAALAAPAPFPLGAVFGVSFLTTVNAAPTADRTINFPDASGTVALTSDLAGYATLISPILTTPNIGAAIATSIGIGATPSAELIELKAGGVDSGYTGITGLAFWSTNISYTTKSRIASNFDGAYFTQNARYNGAWVADNVNRPTAGILLSTITSADGYVAFYTSNSNNAGNGTERARINKDGNLLVGQTTGSEKLEVTGNIKSTGTIRTGGYTVATLPTVGTVGRRAYVTDANSTTYLSTVAGGGSNIVPVFDNGTNWVIA